MVHLVLTADARAAGLGADELRALEQTIGAPRPARWRWSYAGRTEPVAEMPEGAFAVLQEYARAAHVDAPHLIRHDPSRGVFLPEPFDLPAGIEGPLLATSAPRAAGELDLLNQRLGICHHFEDDYYARGDLVRVGCMVLRDALTFGMARSLPLVLGWPRP